MCIRASPHPGRDDRSVSARQFLLRPGGREARGDRYHLDESQRLSGDSGGCDLHLEGGEARDDEGLLCAGDRGRPVSYTHLQRPRGEGADSASEFAPVAAHPPVCRIAGRRSISPRDQVHSRSTSWSPPTQLAYAQVARRDPTNVAISHGRAVTRAAARALRQPEARSRHPADRPAGRRP